MKREWLIEARKAHKMTQAEIADKVGVARQTYLRYESGERTPNAQIALILEVILGVPKEKFFWPGGTEMVHQALAGATA